MRCFSRGRIWMLLGDRTFIDRSESVDFQKTGAFHVLVVAGLHVGALVFFLHWVSRKLKFSRGVEALLILALLLFYVEIVEQRAPVLRASLMTAIVLLGSVLYRRLDLLNSAALAALLLLIANPDYLSDSGFLLSFLAIGCIAGIALPFSDRHIDPFARALTEWRDVTRDASYAPIVVQFRIDFRDTVSALTSRLRGRLGRWAQNFAAGAARASLRVVEMLVLSFVLQLGMLALMARYFHRVSLLGPVANLFAVPLTGVIVPLGFFGLAIGSIFHALTQLVVHPLIWLVILQQRLVSFCDDTSGQLQNPRASAMAVGSVLRRTAPGGTCVTPRKASASPAGQLAPRVLGRIVRRSRYVSFSA
jgi:competence protein ComEC